MKGKKWLPLQIVDEHLLEWNIHVWLINWLTFTLTIIFHTVNYITVLLQFMGFSNKSKISGLSKISLQFTIISPQTGGRHSLRLHLQAGFVTVLIPGREWFTFGYSDRTAVSCGILLRVYLKSLWSRRHRNSSVAVIKVSASSRCLSLPMAVSPLLSQNDSSGSFSECCSAEFLLKFLS